MAQKMENKPMPFFEKRVLRTKPLTKEEALAKLAKKYFSSHCPATLQDFVWWSVVYLLPAFDEFIISYKNRLILVPRILISRTHNQFESKLIPYKRITLEELFVGPKEELNGEEIYAKIK